MRLGQSAFEYILIVGIAMTLIVPGAMLFYNYSIRSSDEVVNSNINMVGNDILDGVEKVYYIGENSWETIKVNIPKGVRRIYVLNQSELVIKYESHIGISDAVFFSDINMTNTLTCTGGLSNFNISQHPGLNVIRITSLGKCVLINETR